MQYTLGALAALAAMPLAFGQTFTDCNPMNKTCSPDDGLQASSFSTDFTKGSSAIKGWSLADGTSLNYGAKGAEFSISKDGQAPTIQTDFHIFFGTVEVTMQAAPGVGIVSSIVFESSDLDEVDWEITGTDTTHAQSDYFGKGNTTAYDRAVYQTVASPQTQFHTYKFDWSAERIVWSIDGTAVRTLNYADANGGTNYPQTPMRLKLGNWAGGCPSCPAGTAEWAGGRTDYGAGPFTMYVKSVSITNANPAAEYVWSDRSGSWKSIQVLDANKKSMKTDQNSTPDANVTMSSTTGSASSTTTHASSTGRTSSVHSTMSTSTSTKTSPSSASAVATGASGFSSSSGSRSNSTVTSSAAPAASSPVQQTTSGASHTPAATSLVLLLSMIMSLWML